MYLRVEVYSNFKTYLIVVTITIMIRWSHDESAGLFWWPAEFENVANPDFESFKHLQNRGHLPLTESSTSGNNNQSGE